MKLTTRQRQIVKILRDNPDAVIQETRDPFLERSTYEVRVNGDWVTSINELTFHEFPDILDEVARQDYTKEKRNYGRVYSHSEYTYTLKPEFRK